MGSVIWCDLGPYLHHVCREYDGLVLWILEAEFFWLILLLPALLHQVCPKASIEFVSCFLKLFC